MTTMTIPVSHLVFDCANTGAMTAFWGALLDMKTTEDDGRWAELEPLGEGGPVLSFQKVPEGKTVKNRLHLDLRVADVPAAEERARALGATLADEPWANRPEHNFRVWRDPEGNEFCFVRAS
ncbi:VOC family protein [Actinomadura kijaniata]|uniref:VOC family protein n=1 Tax=Actinomadura kijaniata TaxID=46161 RepID=UPI001FE0697A|nr:VOC family protein [Actinomadura kijaniata]